MTKPKTEAVPWPGVPCAMCGLPGLVYKPFGFRAGAEVKTVWALGCVFCGFRLPCGRVYHLAA